MPAVLAAPSPACIDKPPVTPKDAARKNSLEKQFWGVRWKKDQSGESLPAMTPTARP